MNHQITAARFLDRGLSAFDVRQRFVLSAVYELPFGTGQLFPSQAPPALKWMASGWQMNTIVQAQTGTPFTPIVSGDLAGNGSPSAQRPNRIADGNLLATQRTPSRWFDTSAFLAAPAGSYGNAGRNVLFQDGSKTIDLSWFKNNYFGEGRFNLQFRTELFNLLNRSNFGPPAASVNGPNFGVVTTTGLAREIQFARKFLF